VLIVSGIILSILIPNSNKSSIKQAKLSGKMSGMVEEIYSGILIVKAFNKETSVEQQFEKQNNQLYHVSRVARTWASMFHVVINFGKFTGQMAICITAAIVATTLPQDEAILLIAMIPTFIIFVYALNYPITQIADNLYRIFCASASCHRIFDVLDKKEIVYTKDTIPIPPDIKGRIIFKNVKFGYNNSKPIIKNLNFKAEPGQKIAIVGSTGAGKTTIVNLIMRFYEINSGKITIDDIDISKMNVLELRNMFGMVLQDT
jgi:ATP-binding cassette subfamily B protein